MILVVAEKPSVAKTIAAVLRATVRHDGWYEGNGYIVSWCVGHLMGLANPDEYNPQFKKWSYSDLPIIPHEWKHVPLSSTTQHLKVLLGLMKRSGVTTIVNGADAGREGELIFRLVYNEAQVVKPVKRLWISSLEESAIQEGFNNLRNSSEYDALYQAARSRQRADWLVGMNFTRLFSIKYGIQLRVGRVQTPTLAMIVERDAKIAAFIKEPFYVPSITDGVLIAEHERLSSKSEAERIVALCRGQKAIVTKVTKQEKSEQPPKLYDLTSLQRDANRMLGLTAQQTLDTVQNLYEEKLVTYPRTDSRYITEDMLPNVRTLVDRLLLKHAISNQSPNCARLADNRKVTDHHAIIPTLSALGVDMPKLTDNLRAVLMLIITRLLSAVDSAYKYMETQVEVQCAGLPFSAKGKTVLLLGWKAVDAALLPKKTSETKDEPPAIPAVHEGWSFIATATYTTGETSPPKRYTEDTLLSAMENAGVDDMPDDAERKGLGTPATRASTIEKLVREGTVLREKKSLVSTRKGQELIAVLPDSVKSPKLTADWETYLKNIENGKLREVSFMNSIYTYVKDTVAQHPPTVESMSDESRAKFAQKYEIVGICPRCKSDVEDREKGFGCTNRGCTFILWKNHKFFYDKKKSLTKTMAKDFLKSGRTLVKGLYSEKTGKKYDATIVLVDDPNSGYANFKMDFSDKVKKR